MNIVTIDPSLSCTAVCINGRFYVYTTNNTAKTKTGTLKKWFKIMDQYVDYRFFESPSNTLSYSKTELAKLRLYNEITDLIISDVALNLDKDSPDTIVCIEGYSYSSSSSAIIDLVTFSTLLRSKIMLDIGYMGVVLSPATLKVKACELTYPERNNAKGKKLPCANHEGTSGGRFKKHEMMKALIENGNLQEDWYVNVLRNECAEAFDKTTIPKPIEDLNDAKLMYEVIVNLANKHDHNLLLIEEELLT